MTKIATCSYCGTRAALVLKGKDRHELACSSCGAPLHEMKMLRADYARGAAHSDPRPRPEKVMKHRPEGPKGKRRKKRKSWTKKFFEEAFDVLEDIFD